MKISPKTFILSGVGCYAKSHPTRTRPIRLAALACSCLFFSLTASAALPTLGNSGASDRALAELGKQSILSAVRHNPTLIDVELHTYLNDLLHTLRSANGLDEYPIDLTLFADRSVNAFALPGGYIGVFTGLVLSASSESALVSVLAHEMAHLSQQHIHRFMERQSQASFAAMAALIAAALVMRSNPDAAQATIYSGLARANQSLLDYSRAHEREADRAGQRLMSVAGFRPEGMAEMFEGLAAQEQLNHGQGLEYLQTHPVTQSRIADAWEGARSFKARGSEDAEAFALLQARAATLVGAPVTTKALPYSLALIALRKGNAQEAKRELAALDARFTDHRAVTLLEAQIDAALGKLEAALQQLQALQMDFPSWYPASHYRAELLSKAGRHQEAASILRQYLRKQENTWPLSYQTLSIYYQQAGDKMNALRWRGEHHAAAENYTAAAHLFEQALEYTKKNSSAAIRLQSRLDQTQKRALQERPFR